MAVGVFTPVDKIAANAGALKGVPVDYLGPSVYVQVAGVGDTMSALTAMLKNIYAIDPVVDSTGTYWVIPLILTNKAVQTVEFKWVTISTGAEVNAGVDLSASRARLMIWGN